jgi:hypothetical protein
MTEYRVRTEDGGRYWIHQRDGKWCLSKKVELPDGKRKYKLVGEGMDSPVNAFDRIVNTDP